MRKSYVNPLVGDEPIRAAVTPLYIGEANVREVTGLPNARRAIDIVRAAGLGSELVTAGRKILIPIDTWHRAMKRCQEAGTGTSGSEATDPAAILRECGIGGQSGATGSH